MRHERILLVNPPYPGRRVKSVFCAGLGYIAEILDHSGFDYDVLDMSLGYTYQDLKRKINKFSPHSIGVSVMTYMYKNTYDLVKSIKEDYPDLDIIAGGPHISLFREKVLLDCPSIDYGVVMEGERTIVNLCRGDSTDTIKGLIFRRGGSVVYNGDPLFIKALDTIPFPRYKKFELSRSIDKDINALPVVSSRGCPFDCIYCPVKCSIGKSFRTRSPGNIIEELTYWYERGFKRFSFADDNFTLIKDRVYTLCDLIQKSNLKDLKLSCDNGIRADKVNRDLLKIMKEAGFYRIAFGVEAGNNKVLKSLKKKESIETIKSRIQESCDLGYDVDLFFLAGSPHETWQDLQDSFKIVSDYPIGTAYFYNIIPFPHTELFDWVEKNGRFLKSPEEYLNEYPILDVDPLFETPDMPYKERKKALKHAFKVMRKTMRRSWAKRLMRYGIFGEFLAYIYTSKFIQDTVLRNKVLRKVIYKTANICFSHS